MGRIFFERYDSSGKFPDGRIKLDVYFEDSEGNKYVYTPDWERGTRSFFLEAYRIERLNRPESGEIERFKQIAGKVVSEEEIQSHGEFRGTLERLEESKLIISYYDDHAFRQAIYHDCLDPQYIEAFCRVETKLPLSTEFIARAIAEAKDLPSWLRRYKRCYGKWLLVNGKLFDVEWKKKK